MLCFPSVRFWPNKKYLSPMSSGASLKKNFSQIEGWKKSKSHNHTHKNIHETIWNDDECRFIHVLDCAVRYFFSACSLSFIQHYRIMQLLIYERVKKLPKYQHTQKRSTDGANHQSLARTKLHCRFGGCLYFGGEEFRL